MKILKYNKKTEKGGIAMRALKHRRKGFTLVELVLALAIIGVAAIGLLVLYNTTVRPSAWINDKIQSFTSLQAALEQARAINGGKYPEATSSIQLGNLGNGTSEQVLRAVLGSPNPQYNQWTYQCSGGTLTIGVYVGDDANTDRRNAVRTAISKNFAGSGWTCDNSVNEQGLFSCRRTNVPCG